MLTQKSMALAALAAGMLVILWHSIRGDREAAQCSTITSTAPSAGKRSSLGWDYTSGTPLVDCNLACRAVAYQDLDPKADILVIGAGLSGSMLAHLHAVHRNETVLVLERRNHIAGNMYDYVDKNGIRCSMYGPHYFHTNDERVWQFLNRFTPWTYYEYRVVANVTDMAGKTIFPTIPINIDTTNKVFGTSIATREEMAEWLKKTQIKFPGGPKNAEEAAQERVGKVLYEKFFKGYTTKQWERDPTDLYPSVTQRIPVWSTHDDRYFNDFHQAKPKYGFTELIRPMLDHQNIRYVLNADFFEFRKHFDVGKYKKVFYTGPIDQYFADQGMETLEYRSLTFNIVTERDVDRPDGSHAGHPWARCRSEADREFVGRLLGSARESDPAQCCARCSNTKGCLYWAYGDGECRLLSTKAKRVRRSGWVSGDRLGKTFQPATTVNQPSVQVPHTRSCEYKWLPWDHQPKSAAGQPHTSIFYEYPSSSGEPYYPIPNERNVQLYMKYQQLAVRLRDTKNIHFVGRLANYKYFNMDQTAANALKVYEEVYPQEAPVVPSSYQDIIVVTVLDRNADRFTGICELAHSIAADGQILWLLIDKDHETGDNNIKDLIAALDLPSRSAYVYGNGADAGLGIAFEYIRKNKLKGAVYVADIKHTHTPMLWEGIRRIAEGKLGILSSGTSASDQLCATVSDGRLVWHGGAPPSDSPVPLFEHQVAFSSQLLLTAPSPLWEGGLSYARWLEKILPSDQHLHREKRWSLPSRWQILSTGCSDDPLVRTTPPTPREMCSDVPGDQLLLVTQL